VVRGRFPDMQMKRSIFLSGILIALSGAANAQTPPAPPAHDAVQPTADRASGCTPTQTTAQGNVAPEGGTTGKSSTPLGDKLAKSDGVLCPPDNVDPAMHAPAPNAGAGSMPVIPPPGSPGGDPNVRPK
jgi:hypothetical protein